MTILGGLKMNYKFSFLAHLKKCAAFYILTTLIVPPTFTYFIYLKNRAKSYEVFSMFVSADLKDKVGIKGLLKTSLPEDLEINCYSCDINNSTFATYYSAKSEISDIIILQESFIKQFDYVPYLDITSLTSFDLSDGYIRDEKIYGLALKNQKHNYLSDYINFDDDNNYYVFINKKSVHLNNIGPDTYFTNQVEKVLQEIYK